MAKFKISPELIKILLPVVVPIAKDLAAKTTTKVDDKIVSALEVALNNPVVLAFLLDMLAGEEEVQRETVTVEQKEAMETLNANADEVAALFAIAKAD